MANLIDGKKVSQDIRKEISNEIQEIYKIIINYKT